MRDDILLKLQRIIEGNDRITWDLFPEIYNGFLEADELSLAEDRMLQLVASAVQTCMDDKVISTASSDKITEYEDGLCLSGEGLTLDERRQQVVDYINRSRVVNEETLHTLAQSKAPGYTVYEKTDPQELTLGVFTEEDDEQGGLPAVGVIDEIRPTVPQNLELYAGVETSFDRPLVVNYAHFSALWTSLGVIEWSPVPPPPPPPPEPEYSFIVVNETTGEVVYSISETEENPSMVFSQVGHIEMPDSDMITVYETGVRTESFYFTTNGRNETENTNISHADIPVYNEDGTAPAADTPYDGSSVLAFMDVEGNTKQAQGEGLYVNDGVLRLDAPDTDEGEQWAALVEYIEPAPLVYDSASGTISGLTLPTSHSGSYTNVTFDTLRYYVKGTAIWLNSVTGAFFGKASTTWYYGTIEWTDESLGDLSSLIQVNPTSSNHLVQQTVFRIIFITGGINGYHPYDTGDSSENLGQITAYSYNNGVHSITFYRTKNWWGFTGTGRIQFGYLDGTTAFNGLDAYDLILVNNGVLSKATTTDRYDMYNTYNGDITIHAEY